MLNDLLLFIVIFALHIILKLIIPKKVLKKSYFKLIGAIGIFFHELSHLIMGLLMGIKPKTFEVNYRKQSGSVGYDSYEDFTFLQIFLISLAPLIFSSYAAFGMVFIMFETPVELIYKLLAGLCFISLLLGACPSTHDIKMIGQQFREDSSYSFYQLILISLSGVVVFLVHHFILEIILPFYLTFLYLIAIGLVYYIIKYLFLGISKLFLWVKIKLESSSSFRSSWKAISSSQKVYQKSSAAHNYQQERIERRQW
ncbi:MAG: conserved membrane protein of unknown function [Promethearchaeota archaeon]|nr:MAG: conserved membrane protein of unknown function [Candidatus Lokiarchaeota archaeon]